MHKVACRSLTSMEVGVGLVRGQEERLSGLQPQEVEEEHTEAADIARELAVQPGYQGSLLGGDVCACVGVGVWVWV